MWLLFNPELNDEVDAVIVFEFIKSLTEVAVLQTRKLIEGLENPPTEPVKLVQREQCLRYLTKAETMLTGFLNGIGAGL